MAASDARADPVARARVLARVREAVLSGSPSPEPPRAVVSESWRRSLAARVNPEGGRPPSVFKPREVAELRAGHPLAGTLPLLRETLVEIADEAMHMMIVTDARGHILWREGHNDVLHLADDSGLTEGTCWSESAIGTNAMGTALAAGRAVQIHAGEHLVSAYHAWTCAASPVRDPDTGEIVGVVDVTGPMRTFHPSIAALVAASAKLAEAHLHAQMQRRDERLRTRCAARLAALGGEPGALLTPTGRVLASASLERLPARLNLPIAPDGSVTADGSITLPDGRSAICEPLPGAYLLRLPAQRGGPPGAGLPGAGLPGGLTDPAGARLPGPVVGVPTARPVLRLRFLGAERPLAVLDGRELRLTQRHADMLVLLALSPSGLSAEQLATGVYGERGKPVTARAEIHRLRAQLGTGVVRSNPYRLHAEVGADFLSVRADLRAGRLRAAATGYGGELLPASEAPAVVELREVLFGTLRRAALDVRDIDAMATLAETEAGSGDIELAEALAEGLPRSDPRRAAAAARLDQLMR